MILSQYWDKSYVVCLKSIFSKAKLFYLKEFYSTILIYFSCIESSDCINNHYQLHVDKLEIIRMEKF